MKRLLDQNPYELLDIERTADAQSIARAYARARAAFAPDAIASYMLGDPDERSRLMRLIEAAFHLLADPVRRAMYDDEGGGWPPEAHPDRTASGAEPHRPSAAIPEVPAEGPIRGELLRRIREARGKSLTDLADKTRISASHLKHIEDDRLDLLPPPVYLRGFLSLLARALELDPVRVVQGYLSR